jgi:hypothetical protein
MRKTLLCTTLALIFDLSAGAQASECSDIALVLAVDGSDSIDDKEYAFQKAAISAAFRDMAVIPTLRWVVAVSAVFWGDAESPTEKVGWFMFTDCGRRELCGHTNIEAMHTPLKAAVKEAQSRKASRKSRSKDFSSTSGG